MSRLWLAIAGVSCLACSVFILVIVYSADSSRLHPARHEIIVRQVDNGYVVEAHVRNNPYPYREAVFSRPDEVGAAVAGLLNERVPAPLWGR